MVNFGRDESCGCEKEGYMTMERFFFLVGRARGIGYDDWAFLPKGKTHHPVRHYIVTLANRRYPRAVVLRNPFVEFLLRYIFVVVVCDGEAEEAFFDGCHCGSWKNGCRESGCW